MIGLRRMLPDRVWDVLLRRIFPTSGEERES